MFRRITPLICLLVISPTTWVSAYQLRVTEIWPGQQGGDLTEDWFEITNTGATDWNSSSSTLSFDNRDDRPASADTITGITTIAAGEAVVVVIGSLSAQNDFDSIWQSVALPNGKTGYIGTSSSGVSSLSESGGTVALYEGSSLIDTAIYPAINSGASHDVWLDRASVVGNISGAVQTRVGGGPGGRVPNIGSPWLIPEPVPSPMMLLGAALLLLMHYRRSRHASQNRPSHSPPAPRGLYREHVTTRRTRNQRNVSYSASRR